MTAETASTQAETCGKCGALVGDAEVHKRWHAKAEDKERSARDAIAQFL